MRSFVTLLSAGLFLVFTGTAVVSATETVAERQLVLSMTLNKKTGERLTTSGEALRAFIRDGSVRRKPDLQADYTDYRVVRKPARLFGHEIVVIEEEYLSQWIGCCVNPGIGMVLETGGRTKDLTDFANDNGCRVDNPGDVGAALKDLGLSAAGRSFLYVSCRTNDIKR